MEEFFQELQSMELSEKIIIILLVVIVLGGVLFGLFKLIDVIFDIFKK